MSGTPGDLDPPSPGAMPVAIPGARLLLGRPGLAVTAGEFTAWPGGFGFTLFMLREVRPGEEAPAGPIALHLGERGLNSWISVRYRDGRTRAADLNANTPPEQPEGPHLRFMEGEASDTEGWDRSRWQVTPLTPPGPVELTIHLGGNSGVTGTGHLDGRLIAEAARPRPPRSAPR